MEDINKKVAQRITKFSDISGPAFILEQNRLVANLVTIQELQNKAGIDVILALKAFSMWPLFPLVGKYLSGAAASSLHEAKLIWEHMKTKAHTYSPAYLPEEFEELLSLSSHITFNSLSEVKKYAQKATNAGVSPGLRVNPEYSDVETDLYNPAGPNSRLGETSANLPNELSDYLEGLHFHVLCESDSYALEKVLHHFERRFGKYLHKLKWVNFGGGHLITKANYDRKHLIKILQAFQSKYPHLKIILEPGAAIAWNTGVLIARVLDIIENHGVKTAILDVSFTAHMPDTLEMPYRPIIVGATNPRPELHNYRLGGVSCLAGDYLEEYGFDQALRVGDRLIFEDMIHYTMVKTTMFNGVKHPDIGLIDQEGNYQLLRQFQYVDFKARLG